MKKMLFLAIVASSVFASCGKKSLAEIDADKTCSCKAAIETGAIIKSMQKDSLTAEKKEALSARLRELDDATNVCITVSPEVLALKGEDLKKYEADFGAVVSKKCPDIASFLGHLKQ